MISRFDRPVPQLSIIVNQMIDIIVSRFGYILECQQQSWGFPKNLTFFSEAVHARGLID